MTTKKQKLLLIVFGLAITGLNFEYKTTCRRLNIFFLRKNTVVPSQQKVDI